MLQLSVVRYISLLTTVIFNSNSTVIALQFYEDGLYGKSGMKLKPDC